MLSNIDVFSNNTLLEGVSDSVVSSLRIMKCTEIPKKDSLEFIKKYPNAYYAVYDKDGFLVEKNSYSTGDVGIEFLIYFLNDEIGNPISWIWIFPEEVNKLTRVRIESYDSLQNNDGYLDTYPGMDRNQVKFNKYRKGKSYSDTLFKPTETIISIYADSARVTLQESKKMYYTANVLDSIITTYSKNSTDVLKVNYSKGRYVSEYYMGEKGGGRGREILYCNGIPCGIKYYYFHDGRWGVAHQSILRIEFYD